MGDTPYQRTHFGTVIVVVEAVFLVFLGVLMVVGPREPMIQIIFGVVVAILLVTGKAERR